jgi:hypothetical protein
VEANLAESRVDLQYVYEINAEGDIMRRLDMRGRSPLFIGLALSAMVTATGSTNAQSVPNLVGTWKGTAQAIQMGVNPYRAPPSSAPVFSTNPMEFTVTIVEQKDNRFTGKKAAGERSETLIGAISPNNQSGVILDDDGQYLFTLRDQNTLDVCYNHLNPSGKVVACYTWKRSL